MGMYAVSAVIFASMIVLTNCHRTPDMTVGSYREGTCIKVTLSYPRCMAICDALKQVCYGFDYNWEKRTCCIHKRSTECRGYGASGMRKHPSWIHYHAARCPNTNTHVARVVSSRCKDELNLDHYVYDVTSGNAAGGQAMAYNVSLVECLNECQNRLSCVGVVWDQTNDGACVEHTTLPSNYNPTETCCKYFHKLCPGRILSSLTTTTTATTTTTVPTKPPPPNAAGFYPEGIDTSGMCPAPLLKVEKSLQIGGDWALNDTTAEACQKLCLGDGQCTSVDYNKEERTCFTHADKYLPAFKRGTEDCCDHYIKTQCGQKCFSHSWTPSSSDPESINVNIPSSIADLQLIDCPTGLCFTTIEIGMTTYRARRGCEGFRSRPQLKCSTSVAGSTMSVQCVCKGHQCNAPALLPYAYYPLDCSASDMAGYMRHGTVVGMQFDGFDAVRNCSGIFDGQGHMLATPFQYVIVGSLSSINTGSITLAFWMKRSSVDGDMTILNNGYRNFAPVEVFSQPVDSSSHLLTAAVRIADITYSLSAVGVLNEWQFVAVVLNRLSGLVAMDMYLSDNNKNLGVPAASISPKVDPVPTATIKQGRFPLYIGAQLQTQLNGMNEAKFNFIGRLDEIYIFNSALSRGKLQAIIDQSKPFP